MPLSSCEKIKEEHDYIYNKEFWGDDFYSENLISIRDGVKNDDIELCDRVLPILEDIVSEAETSS